MPRYDPVDRMLAAAAALARPLISNFRVGAIALGASGRSHLGGNLEFPGHGLEASVHAEQAAVANAWHNGETGITGLVVTATPCGYCRQFLYELRNAAALNVAVHGGASMTLGALLPAAFGPADLNVSVRLMDPLQHNLTLASGGDALANAALDAANRSYAPYTNTLGGVALQLADGSVHAGRTIESAAYNTGLGPLQGALVSMAVAGAPYAAIRRATLVEAAGPATHQDATASLLAGLAPGVQLTYAQAVAL